jgi:ParB family chromosome partitioning protein
MQAATESRVADFQVVPIGQLEESRTNPRKHFAKDSLQDLTQSVKEKGILVPLLVRSCFSTPIKYEIIAGARRYRAAKAAGLTEIPILIRDLDDEQALEVQVIENLQRSDVHPLEEAEGYKQLLEKGKYDIDGLAGKVGKSESYIYQRLKLAELVPAIKKAFLQEKLTAGHAILLARLQPSDQERALKENTRQYHDEGDKFVSVRQLARYIQDEIHLELKGVPWELADAELLPKAGACTVCPKRTGFNKSLFADVSAKDSCTDPGCFNEKMNAQFVKLQAEIEKKGGEIVQVSCEYKPKVGIAEDNWNWAAPNSCEFVATGFVVAGGWKDGRDLKRGQLVHICNNKKCATHWGSGRSSGSSGSGRSTEDKAKDRARRRELDRRGRLFKALVDKKYPWEKEEERRAAVRWAIEKLGHDWVKPICEAMGWEPKKASFGGKDYTETVMEQVEKLPIDQAERWINFAVVANEDLWFGAYTSSIPKSRFLIQAAARAKVDVKAIDKALNEKWKKKAKPAKKTKPTKVQTPAKAKKKAKKAA